MTSNSGKCSRVLRGPTPTPPGRLGHRTQGGPRTEPLRLKPTEEFRRWTGRVWEPPARKSVQAATPCAARRDRALLRLGAAGPGRAQPGVGGAAGVCWERRGGLPVAALPGVFLTRPGGAGEGDGGGERAELGGARRAVGPRGARGSLGRPD